MRTNQRKHDELRPVSIQRGFTDMAPGSVLIGMGQTRVLCTASIDEGVKKWREPSGLGWLTAEYDMLPGATPQRRGRNRSGVDGRSQEIQRLIGRSLRQSLDFAKLGLYTITIDCDVLQADGGTRTAAVTGGWVALQDALRHGQAMGWWGADVATLGVAAVSVGVVGGEVLLDLDYQEDVAAEVDCNLVRTDRDAWIEVQATGEAAPLSDDQLSEMLAVGKRGIETLFAQQQAALEHSSQ